MELRNHPLVRHCGRPAWPPVWSPANPRLDRKSLKGEMGRLEAVLPSFFNACFLIMQQAGRQYIGCLFLDNRTCCGQMTVILQTQIGVSIKEIGSLDLSRALRLNSRTRYCKPHQHTKIRELVR